MDTFFRILEIGAPFIIMINAIIMILPDAIEDYQEWKRKREETQQNQAVDKEKVG